MRAIHRAGDPVAGNRPAPAGRTSPPMRLVASNGSAEINDGESTASLLEREAPLATLACALGEAAAGSGRVVLVHGEAGIGKTSLVESFLAANDTKLRALVGRCDALFTPQPLSPLHEIALRAKGPLLKHIQSPDSQHAIFSTLLSDLQTVHAPTALIFEDVHWADAATLDLLKYLGRRIRNLSALLVLTYRDDELDRSHPLWSVLGNLPADAVRRIVLKPPCLGVRWRVEDHLAYLPQGRTFPEARQVSGVITPL